MLWKIFALISVIAFASGVVRYNPTDWIDVAAIPADIIAVTGVVIYAFHITQGRSRYWIGFAWSYAAFSVFGLYVGVTRSVAQQISTPAIIGALSFATIYQFFNWLALHRLGELGRIQ